jgi:hypothetical protein
MTKGAWWHLVRFTLNVALIITFTLVYRQDRMPYYIFWFLCIHFGIELIYNMSGLYWLSRDHGPGQHISHCEVCRVEMKG